jgi:hypothetical protein
MKRHAVIAPEYGEEEYETKFAQFLRIAIQEFQHGVDHRALFRKARVNMGE